MALGGRLGGCLGMPRNSPSDARMIWALVPRNFAFCLFPFPAQAETLALLSGCFACPGSPILRLLPGASECLGMPRNSWAEISPCWLEAKHLDRNTKDFQHRLENLHFGLFFACKHSKAAILSTEGIFSSYLLWKMFFLCSWLVQLLRLRFCRHTFLGPATRNLLAKLTK